MGGYREVGILSYMIGGGILTYMGGGDSESDMRGMWGF